MTKDEARARIKKLREVINHHRYLYHVLDRQEISDAALDSLKKELEELERRFPDLVTPDSPTQRVGGEPLKEFEKVPHEAPMLSFFDAFDEEEMREWKKRMENFLRRPLSSDFFCELKIDGLAVELIYEKGVLSRGLTRGDGAVGEDVTQNLKTIEAVPLSLERNHAYYPHIVVRGEVFMSKAEFARINRQIAKKGGTPYANPRNLAAGTIRQLDPKVAAARRLDFFAYDIVTGGTYRTHAQIHKTLKKWGFKVNPHDRVCPTLEEVFSMRNEWEKRRALLPYQIDGIVVIVNDTATFRKLGVVGKAPRGAIAYKFAPEEATTVIEDVVFQVGRTGIITPVAVFRPVNIGGVRVTHATLHNFDEIQRLGLRVGDTAIVSRAGDVIPKVVRVLKDLRRGNEKKIIPPRRCPVDDAPVIKEGAYYKCSNTKCGAVRRRWIIHFVSRGAFNVEGMGEKIVDRLIDEGLISSPDDIFTLTEGDIAVLPGFGKKSAQNLISEIRGRKSISFEKFLFALGIRHVGEETARLIARTAVERGWVKGEKVRPDIIGEAFARIRKDEWKGISDIGPETAESISSWFRDRAHQEFLRRLSDVGVRVLVAHTNQSKDSVTRAVAGKTFVFTGTLSSMSRTQAEDAVRAGGGRVLKSVSRRTDYVVAGEDPGSKLKKAQDFGVRVITEEEFLQMLKH